MKKTEIFERLKVIGNVDMNLDLADDLLIDHRLREEGINSIVLMAYIVYIENEFQINLDELYELNQDELTFLQLVDIIHKQKV